MGKRTKRDDLVITIEQITTNAVRRMSVVQTFEQNVGRRVLIMIPQYPFFVVGKIVKVDSDFAFIRIEFNNVVELDGNIMRIHIGEIEVFFIESNQHKIPRISL